VASLSAIGTFACGTGWLLDSWGGSRRRGESGLGFSRSTSVETALLLLSGVTTVAVAMKTDKFVVKSVYGQLCHYLDLGLDVPLLVNSVLFDIASRLEIVDTVRRSRLANASLILSTPP
jgi:hypothetical protein